MRLLNFLLRITDKAFRVVKLHVCQKLEVVQRLCYITKGMSTQDTLLHARLAFTSWALGA